MHLPYSFLSQDDYLTEYEIIKMKELYRKQIGHLSAGLFLCGVVGWGLTYPLMGPIVRSSVHAWYFRLPVATSFTTFLWQQDQYWVGKNKPFTELMVQPAPHGSYLRRSIKEHFPVWWKDISAQLHKGGHNLPEMNEYDRIRFMPKSATKFNDMKS